jgi:hypothetical protein
MPNILIPYIATGKYYDRLGTFKESVPKFCPGSNKFIHIASDKVTLKQEYKHYEGCHRIDHLPWPIVALMKFKHILDSFNLANDWVTMDYIFYFNSNIKFIDECPDELFLTDKIITVHNVGWDYLGHDPLHFTYEKPLDSKSATYIEGWYDYCQSCLFGGPTDLMIQLCNECHEMITYDLAHNRIPVFHDETAFNKWVHTHKDQVTILDGDWCAAEDHPEWGHPNAHIVLTNSDDTQYNYKDKYHATN